MRGALGVDQNSTSWLVTEPRRFLDLIYVHEFYFIRYICASNRYRLASRFTCRCARHFFRPFLFFLLLYITRRKQSRSLSDWSVSRLGNRTHTHLVSRCRENENNVVTSRNVETKRPTCFPGTGILSCGFRRFEGRDRAERMRIKMYSIPMSRYRLIHQPS